MGGWLRDAATSFFRGAAGGRGDASPELARDQQPEADPMKSEQLFESAQKHLIGGAGAGGRYHPLLKRPLYLARGQGSRFWDVDGKEYIDFFTGSGANFLGHDHPAISAAIREALEVGVICNGETEYHSRLADLVADAVPCAEKIRFANSGTEATMGAIRIARGYTRSPRS